MAEGQDTREQPTGNTPEEQKRITWWFRCALNRICDHNDPAQAAAWSMAYTAINALVTKDPAAFEAVREWSAFVRGARDPDSPQLAMVNLAHDVRIASDLLQQREGRDENGKAVWPGADGDPEMFHDALAALAQRTHPDGLPSGCSVPSVDELT